MLTYIRVERGFQLNVCSDYRCVGKWSLVSLRKIHSHNNEMHSIAHATLYIYIFSQNWLSPICRCYFLETIKMFALQFLLRVFYMQMSLIRGFIFQTILNEIFWNVLPNVLEFSSYFFSHRNVQYSEVFICNVLPNVMNFHEINRLIFLLNSFSQSCFHFRISNSHHNFEFTSKYFENCAMFFFFFAISMQFLCRIC